MMQCNLRSWNFVVRATSVAGVTVLLWLALVAASSALPTSSVPVQTSRHGIGASEYAPLSRASVLMQEGRNAEALTPLIVAVERNPINILAQYNLGCAYLDLAKHSEVPLEQTVFLTQAQQAFERVLNLNDGLTMAYFKLGKIALLRNDLSAAEGYYKAGLETDPKNAALIFNLARIYDQAGRRDDAIAFYQKTIELDGRFVFAYNNLALMYEDAGDVRNAEKTYQQALKREPRYNLARLNLGNLYAASGRYPQALKTLEAARAVEPDNAWVHYYLGNLYMRMADYNQAATAYHHAASLNPGNPTTYYLLAVSLTRLKRMDEALQAGLNYMQLAPEGEYAKEMKSLIMTVKLSQSGGLYVSPVSATVLLKDAH